MDFGKRLKQLRTDKGLTQLQLANILETAKSNISKYEAGSVEPNLETLLKLSKLFDVSVDYLLGISGPDVTQVIKSGNDKSSGNFFFFFDDLLKDVFKMRLGDELEKHDLSANQLAVACSIDTDTCESYLSGEQAPTLENLLTIARVLGTTTDYLLGQIDERFDGFISAFRQLNDDSKDIIIGDTKKLLKEQKYEESVAAEEEPMKEAK